MVLWSSSVQYHLLRGCPCQQCSNESPQPVLCLGWLLAVSWLAASTVTVDGKRLPVLQQERWPPPVVQPVRWPPRGPKLLRAPLSRACPRSATPTLPPTPAPPAKQLPSLSGRRIVWAHFSRSLAGLSSAPQLLPPRERRRESAYAEGSPEGPSEHGG